MLIDPGNEIDSNASWRHWSGQSHCMLSSWWCTVCWHSNYSEACKKSRNLLPTILHIMFYRYVLPYHMYIFISNLSVWFSTVASIYQKRDSSTTFHRTFRRPKDWATLRSTLLVPLQRKAKTFTPWAFKPFNTLSCLACLAKNACFLQQKDEKDSWTKYGYAKIMLIKSNLFDTFCNFRQLYKQNVLETGWPLHFQINVDQVSRLMRHREQRCKLPVFTQLCASKQPNYWMSGLAILRSFK